MQAAVDKWLEAAASLEAAAASWLPHTGAAATDEVRRHLLSHLAAVTCCWLILCYSYYLVGGP